MDIAPNRSKPFEEASDLNHSISNKPHFCCCLEGDMGPVKALPIGLLLFHFARVKRVCRAGSEPFEIRYIEWYKTLR